MAGPLLAGAAKINITPPPGIPLAGYGARTLPCSGIHDDLWAQALVLDDGQRQIAILTIDSLALPHQWVSELRSSIPFHPLLCATHTHSAPDLEKADSYRVELGRRLQAVTQAAMQNRRPASLRIGIGSFREIARNRRPAGGLIDPEVGVVCVEWSRGDRIAILVNYACHATVLGADNLLVTADYPGAMRRAIERRTSSDTIVLFANGAAGNVNPGGYSPEMSMIGRPIPHRTFADAEHFGTALGQVVLDVLEQPASTAMPMVGSLSVQLALRLKGRLSREELETNLQNRQHALAELKERGAGFEECTAAEIQLAYARLAFSLRDTLERQGATAQAEIQAVRIGDAYLVGIPGEPFVETGLEIKRRSGLPNVLVVGYANGYLGYLPTAAAHAVGGYEPTAALVAPGADRQIVDAALSVLGRLSHD